MADNGTVRAAAIYARISSDVEGTGLGVARQIADCRALAERLGWPVAEVYEDNDLSAYSGKRRPRYEEMLADLAEGTRDAVIVYHVDRLTRRPIELEQFVAAIDSARVKQMRFVVGDSDIMTGDGLMVVRMLAAMAANESATKSRRVLRKLDENAAQGRPHGRRVFGYAADNMALNEDEAAVIRGWVKQFLAGESIASITKTAQKSGQLSPTGKRLNTSVVRGLLVSPRIAGLRVHRGTVIGPGLWQPIITDAEHRAVLAKLATRSMQGRRSPRSYLLSSLLRCWSCDHTLYPAVRYYGEKKVRRYRCQTDVNSSACGKLTVVAEQLEDLISDFVILRMDSPQLADAVKGLTDADNRLARVSEDLSADEAQLAELADAYGQKAISMSEWLTARKPVEARIESARRQLSKATNTRALDGFIGNGAVLRAAWPDMPLPRKHAIISAVMHHVVIGPGKRGFRGLDTSRVDPIWKL